MERKAPSPTPSPLSGEQVVPVKTPAGSQSGTASQPISVSIGSSPASPTISVASTVPSHQRHSSIADFLSTPPPLSSATFQSEDGSRGSVGGSEDGSAISLDWQDIHLSDLVDKSRLVFVDADSSVEKAFDILDENQFTSLPIRSKTRSNSAGSESSPSSSLNTEYSVTHTFDYADLNAYLLLVLGNIDPIEESAEVKETVVKAREGKPVPVKFVSQLGIKDPFVVVSSDTTLSVAVEILGNGVHRIAVNDPRNPKEVVGVISQRRLIRYIWENGRKFKSLETLFQTPLKELNVGSKVVITINGESLVIDALLLMHNEGVSSLAVVDNANNLLGNISIVDVRLLTKVSQSKYLRYTCKQFLTVILSKRGVADGQDSYPVFHVTMESTLGRTIAKLVATKAHRLWIVQAPKIDPSPTSPVHQPISGHLVGVISLTDILYIFARHAGKDYLDPGSARRQRRRSSTSSVRTQSSVDKLRRSLSIDRRN
jgi:CBS domain-containing protein